MSPGPTYRLQLRDGFAFDDVADLADYLTDLGVSRVYLSPVFSATEGSSHGYDVVDPRTIDPELGGEPGYTRMTAALREHGLGQLLDIVPNHMATDPANPWWWDVLANGPSSRYARFFDIDWEGPSQASWSKVLAPILGDHYGRVLEAGELELAREGAGFEVRYHEHRLPLSPESTAIVLSPAARRSGSDELAGIAEQLRLLPAPGADAAAARERHQMVERLYAELGRLLIDSGMAEAVDAEARAVSADVDRLHELLDEQNYRLAHWRTANEEIDYRRFFSIETLVGVRADDPEVLAESHGLVFDLVRDGSVDGLRVDHIDGIRNPERYLDQLSTSTDGVYTVVEKILEEDEHLPDDWPVSGTTGYDFLNRVNSVFVDPAAEDRITRIYRTVVGETAEYSDVLHASKRHIMATSMSAELQSLTAILDQLCSVRRRHRDHTRGALRETLAELIAAFGVYRLYAAPGTEPSQADTEQMDAAVAGALQRSPDLDRELLDLIAGLALGRVEGDLEAEFTRRFQQLTAPVMAKGAEDTAFYRYNRFLSLNEVGGDPARFGIDVATFHEQTAEAARAWPETMLTIGTHDTKRSADVRARLDVLSEIPEAWESAVTRWRELCDPLRKGGMPDANTEYHFYQALLGAWPIDVDRIRQYMAKAVREAKTHTSWMSPDPDYESAVDEFVSSALGSEAFVASVEDFLGSHDLVARGRRSSLRQLALLLTCPGIPDVYQGSEVWDLSLVDPDNRRPVDYDLRRRLLDEVEDSAWPGLADGDDDDGVAKMWLTHRLLRHRRTADTTGAYQPLTVRGRRRGEVLAYVSGTIAGVVPVRSDTEWSDTSVELPSGPWRNVLTGERFDGGAIDLPDLLGPVPLAVLMGDGS